MMIEIVAAIAINAKNIPHIMRFDFDILIFVKV